MQGGCGVPAHARGCGCAERGLCVVEAASSCRGPCSTSGSHVRTTLCPGPGPGVPLPQPPSLSQLRDLFWQGEYDEPDLPQSAPQGASAPIPLPHCTDLSGSPLEADPHSPLRTRSRVQGLGAPLSHCPVAPLSGSCTVSMDWCVHLLFCVRVSGRLGGSLSGRSVVSILHCHMAGGCPVVALAHCLGFPGPALDDHSWPLSPSNIIFEERPSPDFPHPRTTFHPNLAVSLGGNPNEYPFFCWRGSSELVVARLLAKARRSGGYRVGCSYAR